MRETQTHSKPVSWQNSENSTEQTQSHTLKPLRRPNGALEHLLQSESSNLRIKKNHEELHSRTQLARLCDCLHVYTFLIFM